MSPGKKPHGGIAKTLNGGKQAWMVKEEFIWKDIGKDEMQNYSRYRDNAHST